MLMHLSKTRTLQRFSKAQKQQEKPTKQAVSDNIIAFPMPCIHQSKTSNRQQVPGCAKQLITKRQLRYIQVLSKQNRMSAESLNNLCFRAYGADLTTIGRVDASHLIQAFKRSL